MARPAMRKALLLLGLLLCIAGVRTQEVEDESEFNYIKGDERGPEHWGELDEEWRACGNGRQQSPIALVKSEAVISPDLGELRRNYYPANATLENRGHDIMVKWPTGGGSLVIEGKSYRLNQCHWHSPAEHSVDGTTYPLEIHLVHQAEDNTSAVIAIFYAYGKPDTFLSKLADEIASIADKEPPVEALGMVDANDIEIGSKEYYRYNGSLTTPPCTEGVTWSIIEKVNTVSEEQVKSLQTAIHDENKFNARPIQPTNGRIVEIYNP
ncbi:hypothetical protein SUGI_0473580 [Cryptomeria japonica]|nr:hypothetical protein SUGI_0473580 [Cryptomeria japonica]